MRSHSSLSKPFFFHLLGGARESPSAKSGPSTISRLPGLPSVRRVSAGLGFLPRVATGTSWWWDAVGCACRGHFRDRTSRNSFRGHVRKDSGWSCGFLVHQDSPPYPHWGALASHHSLRCSSGAPGRAASRPRTRRDTSPSSCSTTHRPVHQRGTWCTVTPSCLRPRRAHSRRGAGSCDGRARLVLPASRPGREHTGGASAGRRPGPCATSRRSRVAQHSPSASVRQPPARGRPWPVADPHLDAGQAVVHDRPAPHPRGRKLARTAKPMMRLAYLVRTVTSTVN